MSGTEWDGAPQGAESWAGYESQAAAEPVAEHQPPSGVGQPIIGSEPWYANRAPLEPHPNWYQPVAPPRRRRRRPLLAAAAAAAVVIIGAAAAAVIMSPKANSPQAGSAGSTHSSSPPKPSSTHPAPASTQQGGSKLTAARAVTTASRKSARLRSVSATFTESISGATAATITGKVTEQRNPLLLSMKVNEIQGSTNISISAILDTNAIYLKFGGTATGLPTALAHKWIKITLAQLGSGSKIATVMQGVQNANPVSQVQLLVAGEHLRAAGTAEVGGVITTKYTGSFKPSIAVRYLSASLRTALGPALKQVKGNVTFTIWIDARRRILQFNEVEHVQSSTVRITSRYSGFNAPVHLALPPASKVVTPAASALSSAG